MEALQVLVDEAAGPRLPLPPGLELLYGGELKMAVERLYANFVISIDGVVALGDRAISSGPALSGRSEADRFVMGLLRAVAGAVLIGGGTLRDDPGHLWTADYIFPAGSSDFARLRRALGLDERPQLVVVTGSGSIDPSERALDQGALVLTTEAGAARLRGRLPERCRVQVLGDDFTILQALAAVRAEGHRRILSEGGPQILTQLVATGSLDELFVTLSPVLAGRADQIRRLGLLEGLALPPQRLRWVRLLSARRHQAHLLLRYGLTDSFRRSGPE